jgi:nucleoside phosphorylase
MIISEAPYLLREILMATEKADALLRKLAERDVKKGIHGQLLRAHDHVYRTLEENQKWASELEDKLDTSKESWWNKMIIFLIEEFINEERASLGTKKRVGLTSLRNHNSISKTEAAIHFQPFLDIYKRWDQWKIANCFSSNCVLVVTALPIEFRAVVRRLSGILRIDHFNRESKGDRDQPKLNMMYVINKVFNPENDERNPVFQNYWLFVTGIAESYGQRVMVRVLLLPEYGGHVAQKGTEVAHELFCESGFDEYQDILVVGIAGRLLPSLDLGSVVVSRRIYDGTLQKRSPCPAGGVEFPNSKSPHKWEDDETTTETIVDEIAAHANDLRQRFHVVHPEQESRSMQLPENGHLGVHFVDVLSISTLVKDENYRETLNSHFPSCHALEMEALGCVHGNNSNVPIRVIKGLCDKADAQKDDKWKAYCADAAAAVAIEYIGKVKQFREEKRPI